MNYLNYNISEKSGNLRRLAGATFYRNSPSNSRQELGKDVWNEENRGFNGCVGVDRVFYCWERDKRVYEVAFEAATSTGPARTGKVRVTVEKLNDTWQISRLEDAGGASLLPGVIIPAASEL